MMTFNPLYLELHHNQSIAHMPVWTLIVDSSQLCHNGVITKIALCDRSLIFMSNNPWGGTHIRK